MYIFSNLWANFSNWWWPSEPAPACENILETLSNNQLKTPDFLKPASCLIEDVYREYGTAAAICTASAIGLGIYKGGGFHYLYNRLQSIPSDDFIHAVRAILKSQYSEEYKKYNEFLTRLQDAINQFLPKAKEQNQPARTVKVDPTLREDFINKTVNFITTRCNEFQLASTERKDQIISELRDVYNGKDAPENKITTVASSSSRCTGT